MTAAIGYAIEGVMYLGLIAFMWALTWEAWRKARERDEARERRGAGDMYVSREAKG